MTIDTNTFLFIVKEIDEQIGSILLQETNRETLKHLMDLRNRILTKYCPDRNTDWTISNNNALETLKHFNWILTWK